MEKLETGRQPQNTQQAGSRISIIGMVQTAIFGAIIIIMAFTPFLGYIPLGFTRATIIHIPVIIGSLMLGPKRGAALGFVFGLTSFINNTINPSVTSFVFTPFYSLGEYSGGFGSILICFLPRILVGVVPYYVYRLVTKIAGKWEKKGTAAGLALAGLSGSLTNTLLVMHMILLFFGHDYAMASEITGNVYLAILAVIGINGVPEAIVAAVIVMLIGKVLMNTKVMKNIGV